MQNQQQMQSQEEQKELYFKPIQIKFKTQQEKYEKSKQTVNPTDLTKMLEENINKKMDRILQYLNNTKIYIVFFGTTSSGKSTFLNALLGQQLLPSRNQSCTKQVAQIGHQDTISSQNTNISINEQSFATLDEASKYLTKMRNSPNMDKINIKTQSYFHKTLSKDLQDRVYFIDTPGIEIYGCSDIEYLGQFEKINQQIKDEYSVRINVWISDYTTFDRDKKFQSQIISSLRNKREQDQQQQNQNHKDDNQIQQYIDQNSQLFFILNKFDQRKESEDQTLEEIYQEIKNVFDSDIIFKISAQRALNYNIMNYGTIDAQNNLIKNYYQNTESNLDFTDESQAKQYCQNKIKNNQQLIKFQDFEHFMSEILLQIKKILDELFHHNLLEDLMQQILTLQFGDDIKNAKQQLTKQQKDEIHRFGETFEQNWIDYEQELLKYKKKFVESIDQMIKEAKELIYTQDPKAVIENNCLKTFYQLEELHQKLFDVTLQSKNQLFLKLNFALQYGTNQEQQPSTIAKRCEEIFDQFMENNISEYLEQFVAQSTELNSNLGTRVKRSLIERASAASNRMINNKSVTILSCIMSGSAVYCLRRGFSAVFKVNIGTLTFAEYTFNLLMGHYLGELYIQESTKLQYRKPLLMEKLDNWNKGLNKQSQDLLCIYIKQYTKALTEIRDLLQ